MRQTGTLSATPATYHPGATKQRRRLTGPNASVEFDAKADNLGVTAVGDKADAASCHGRIHLAHFRYVRVSVALKYLRTPQTHAQTDRVNGDNHIHRVIESTGNNIVDE